MMLSSTNIESLDMMHLHIRTWEHTLAILQAYANVFGAGVNSHVAPTCERIDVVREASHTVQGSDRTGASRRAREPATNGAGVPLQREQAARQTHGSGAGAPPAGPTSERFSRSRISGVGAAADVVILQRCSETSNCEHTL